LRGPDPPQHRRSCQPTHDIGAKRHSSTGPAAQQRLVAGTPSHGLEIARLGLAAMQADRQRVHIAVRPQVGPLDRQHGRGRIGVGVLVGEAVEQRLQAERFERCRRGAIAVIGRESKEVDVQQRHRAIVRQADVEGGAADAVGPVQLHAATERARERGLARAHRAFQQKHGARRDERAEPLAERLELFLVETGAPHVGGSVPPRCACGTDAPMQPVRLLALPWIAAVALAGCDGGGAQPRSVGLQIPEPTEPLRPVEQRGSVPEQARVTDYAIDAKLDEESFRITGLERITFRNRSMQPVDHLALHLYMNAFSAEDTAWMREGRGSHRASGQGRKTPWGRVEVTSMRTAEDKQTLTLVPGDDPTVATVPLPRAVAPGEQIEVDIGFVTHLPEVFARTGYKQDFVLAGQWFPKLAVLRNDGTWDNHVFTFHSEFFADFGDYRVILDVPKAWVVGASGIRTAEEDDGERRRLTYEAAMVHDFAWAASPEFVEHIATHDGIRIRQLHTGETWRDAGVHFAAQAEALDSMQARFGPYPWSTITIVHPPGRAGGAGGMEYPTFFTSSPLFDIPAAAENIVAVRLDGRFTTVHEFGHQYFQGLLASNEFDAPWLDEGLNTFSNTLVLEDSPEGDWAVRVLGHTLDSGDLLRLDMARLQGTAVIDQRADQFAETEALYGRTVYRKTAAAFRSLRKLVGVERFDAAMRVYADRYRFAHPQPDDLIDTLAEALADDASAPGLVALGNDVTLDVRDWLHQALRTPSSVAFAVRWVENRDVQGDAGWHRGEDGVWTETPRPTPPAATEDDPSPSAAEPEGVVVFERSGAFVTPVQYAITFRDGTTEEGWWDGKRTTDTLLFPGRPITAVSLDPHRHLELEAERFDNHRYARRDERPTTTEGDLADLTEAALLSALLGVAP